MFTGDHEANVASIRSKYERLPEREQLTLSNLHDVHLYRGEKTIEGIVFTSNAAVKCGAWCSKFRERRQHTSDESACVCGSADMYPHFSRFNHRCTFPNVQWDTERQWPHRMRMWTLRDVRRGEELCISYRSTEELPFRCVCDDCKDSCFSAQYVEYRFS